jgi:GxxExxY protein
VQQDNGRDLLHERLTHLAIGAFYDVYNELYGLPEHVLRRALVVTLANAGLVVAQEVELPVWFRGHQLTRFRADLVLEGSVIIEVKTAPEIQPFHKKQLLHYLQATDLEVGLLFNFGNRPAITRVVYQNARKRPRYEPPADLTLDGPETPT